jgi:hypothetical protein
MNMEPVNTAAVSTAPDFAGVLRRRLDHVPGKVLASELAYDESHIGKFLNGTGAMTLRHVAKLVEIAKLKAVDADRTCVRKAEIQYLRELYARVQSQAPWLLDEAEA